MLFESPQGLEVLGQDAQRPALVAVEEVVVAVGKGRPIGSGRDLVRLRQGDLLQSRFAGLNRRGAGMVAGSAGIRTRTPAVHAGASGRIGFFGDLRRGMIGTLYA